MTPPPPAGTQPAGPDDRVPGMSTTTRPGAEAEFSAFVTASAPGLHRTARLLTGDAHRAEELVQATLVKTYLAWPRARATDPEAYARRVLANQRIDTWRRHRREVLTDPAAVPERPSGARAAADTAADRDEVVRALLTLTPRQRRVVVLRYLVGLSEAEVAADLGVSVGTVKSTASRGLERLRAVLAPAPDATGAATDGEGVAARLRDGAGAPVGAAPARAADVVARAGAVRRRRRALATGALAVVAVVGAVLGAGALGRSAPPPATADWPVYGSPTALAEAADLVVEGTVTAERREDIDIDLGPREDLVAHDVYTVAVERAYRGVAGGEVEVAVAAPAGRPTAEPRLEVGARYVLFLAESFDGRPRHLLNPFEAVHRVADDGSLAPVSAEDSLTLRLTREDLDAMADAP